MSVASTPALTPRDLVTDQEVRWCPGCGDYSILKQMQTILPELGIPREDIVIVSGIGCSSRFPYYLDTYGIHTIHGRATAVATGVKLANPKLSVWVVTGDGDALSIGANHTMHLLRRNLDINVLVFNNEIYGLTKGQYSPTSPLGTINKTAPTGTADHPVNPAAFALGSQASFVSRTIDRDPASMREVLLAAAQHRGTSFVEIYQNCNVFNDKVFEPFSDKSTKADTTLYLKTDQPLRFGQNADKSICMEGTRPVVRPSSDVDSESEWVHDPSDLTKAFMLSQFFDSPHQIDETEAYLPRPMGIIYQNERNTYEENLKNRREAILATNDLQSLLNGNQTWVVD